MDPALRKQLVAAAIGLATGILTTYAMVWRDVGVIKVELAHIKSDISVIQMFISNDDPRAFAAAKSIIREEHKKDSTAEQAPTQ
jgi:hypothetical protein